MPRRFYQFDMRFTFDHGRGVRGVGKRFRGFGATLGFCAAPPAATSRELGPSEVGSKRPHSAIDGGESSDDAQNENPRQRRKIKSVRGRRDRRTTATQERDESSSILETQGPHSPSSGQSPVSSGGRDLNGRPRGKRQEQGKQRGGGEYENTDGDEEEEGNGEEEKEEEKEEENEEEKKKKVKAKKVAKPSKTPQTPRAKGAGIQKQKPKPKRTGGAKARGRAATGKQES